MRLLLPVILALLGLGGGVAAGIFLGGGNTETTEAEAQPDSASDDTSSDDSAPPNTDGLYEYVRLNNQFIVPIIRHGSVRSLVVMSLTIETEPGQNQSVYSREPRLRDAFLRVMFAHANIGGFDGNFTSVETMAPLRQGLREAARQILGATANDVLIVDIVRQDA